MTEKRKRRTRAQMYEAYRREARRVWHREGVIEIDETAPISRAAGNPDKGAYVQAWVWVDDDTTLWVDDAKRKA
jgi:hypothetical protein